MLAITPVLFFILLELSLRLAGYGRAITQWVEIVPGKLVLNPEIALRYFGGEHTSLASIQDAFDAVKSPRAVRIFIMGESSAAGYPYLPIGSFSRYLQKRFEVAFPDRTIEMVNVSITATSSYTLCDLVPGVLAQHPDALLIYAGHNEYYGAMAVGSAESVRGNRWLVRTMLALDRFRVVQLLRALIGKLQSEKPGRPEQATLMSRMAREQYIPYGSDLYRRGIEQFEDNLRDLLAMARDAHVPVVLGTQVCNLKDQQPFISDSTAGAGNAAMLYERAGAALRTVDVPQANSLFRRAKDFDLLRFRAPEELNHTILRLGEEFGCPVVRVDSVFDRLSPEGVTGDNLLTDHVHPTIEGQRIIGRLYFDAIVGSGIIGGLGQSALSASVQDSITLRIVPFSPLDSMMAAYRIAILKNDWPFRKTGTPVPLEALLPPVNGIDSFASAVIRGSLTWEQGQRRAAAWYLDHGRLDDFKRQIDVLLAQYPFVPEYYEHAARDMIQARRLDDAFMYLTKRARLGRSAYASKWIGIIQLLRKRTPEAIDALSTSVTLDGSDPQSWLYLANAFVLARNFPRASDAVERTLALDPRNTKARELRTMLRGLMEAGPKRGP
jgi:tetratricopeptide (TPR) repeat protein